MTGRAVRFEIKGVGGFIAGEDAVNAGARLAAVFAFQRIFRRPISRLIGRRVCVVAGFIFAAFGCQPRRQGRLHNAGII